MDCYVYVQENRRFGLPFGTGRELNSVVRFKGAGSPPEPRRVVMAELGPASDGYPTVERWRYSDDWVPVADVHRLTEPVAGAPVPAIAPDRLQGEDRERFAAASHKAGDTYLIRPADAAGFVTHYVFRSVADERVWIAEHVGDGDGFGSYDGRPIVFRDETAKLLLGSLDTTLVARAMGEDLDRLRREVERTRERLGATEGDLAALRAEQERLTRRTEQARVELEAAERRAMAKLSEEAEADARVRTLREEQQRLEERLAGLATELKRRRESLGAENAALEAEHRRLLREVQEVRSRARSRHDAEDPRVAELRTLPALEGELEAIEALVDLLDDRADPVDVIAVHVALKHFPFTVLTGPSGSGKSSLLRAYGEALGVYTEMIPVQPRWTGTADLHGYVFPIGSTRHFVTTPFSRALGMQVEEEEFLSLAILDEINLSHVEYYLADYLSAFEHDRVVDLASPLELEGAKAPEWIAAARGRVEVPHTFLVAGTANEDHTTRAFSDKFRDRMAALEMRPRRPAQASAQDAGEQEPSRIGRVTPEAWRRWRELPAVAGNRTKDTKARRVANDVFAALRDARIELGHRQHRDLDVFMRASAPLLATQPGSAEANAHRACDVVLEMRVLQKCAPLLASVRDRDPASFNEVVAAIDQAVGPQRRNYPRVNRWLENVKGAAR